MDANPFLDYLREHQTTAGLAEVLANVVEMRRSLAMQRSSAQLGLIPIRVETGARARSAS